MAIAPPANAGKASSDKPSVPPSSEQLSTAEMDRRIKLLQVDRYIYETTIAQLFWVKMNCHQTRFTFNLSTAERLLTC